MRAVLLLLLLVPTCFAELPEAPQPKPHRFADKQNVGAFAAAFALRSVDSASTCYNLANTPTWRERWLPVKSCVGVASYNVASVTAGAAAAYLLHRTHHHRLERWMPWATAAGAAAGIIYTHKNSK